MKNPFKKLRRRNGRRLIARGAVAGLAGALAMRAGRMVETLGLPRGEKAKGGGRLAVDAMARKRELHPPRAVLAGAGLLAELGFGAALGAAYALSRRVVRAPGWIAGPLLGAGAWALTAPSRGLLPRLGALPPAPMQSMDKTLVQFAENITLGCATVAAVSASERW